MSSLTSDPTDLSSTRSLPEGVRGAYRESIHVHAIEKRRELAIVWLWRIALMVVVVGGWQWGVTAGRLDSLFFPPPLQIAQFVVSFIVSGEFLPHLIVTARATVIGFVMGSLLGASAGLLRESAPLVKKITDPFVTLVNALPRVALAPMFIIWFGIGEASKVALAVSLVFFIVLIGTESGIRSIDTEFQRLMTTLGASRSLRFRRVMLPGAVAGIFGGLRLGVVYSLVGVVFGEMLAARAGLGQQIQFYSTTFATDKVLGILVILAFFAVGINAVLGRVENRLQRWQGD